MTFFRSLPRAFPFQIVPSTLFAHPRLHNAPLNDYYSGYPGLIAQIPEVLVSELLHLAGPYLLPSLPSNLARMLTVDQARGFASVLCINPLISGQGHRHPMASYPHFDSLQEGIAMVWYLNDGKEMDGKSSSGTAFYRLNGVESTTADEKSSEYLRSKMIEGIKGPENKVPPFQEVFEELDRVAFKQGGVVAYPRTVFHSGVVEEEADLKCDSKGGRLTISLFFGPMEKGNVPLLKGTW